MSGPWRYSIHILIIFGSLCVINAKKKSDDDEKEEISPVTNNMLVAASILFRYLMKTVPIASTNTREENIMHKIIDRSTLEQIENGQAKNIINYWSFSNLKYVFRSKKPFTRGAIDVYLTPEDLRHLKLDKRKTTEVNKGRFCVINIKLLDHNHPLIIEPNDHSKLIYPDDDGNIMFAPEEEVLLSCAKTRFEEIDMQATYFKCFRDGIFHYGPFYINFRDIKCQTTILPDWKRIFIDYSSENGISELKIVESHFVNYVDNRDTELYYLTFVTDLYDDKKVYHTRSVVSKHIEGSQNIIYDEKLDDVMSYDNDHRSSLKFYENKEQDRSFQQQLISSPNTICTIDNRLVKSHLVPPISMVYAVSALRTYYFLNYSPQWMSIWNNNWDTINRHINKMASYLEKDLTVLTGAYKDFQAINQDDTDKKLLFLNYRLDSTTLVTEFPVKLYFFKIVIEPTEQKGVVFITVNNPYLTAFPLHELCEEPQFPILQSKSGCKWQAKYVYYGYSYTCSVDGFFKKSRYPIREEITKNVDLLPVELEYEI